MAEKYKPLAGNVDRVKVLAPAEVDALVKEAAETLLTKELLENAYKDVEQYRDAQAGGKKKKKE